jgi:hypothetical protein
MRAAEYGFPGTRFVGNLVNKGKEKGRGPLKHPRSRTGAQQQKRAGAPIRNPAQVLTKRRYDYILRPAERA